MISQVFKYPLEVTDMQTVELQGEPLSVAVQHENLVLYAIYSNGTPVKKYRVRIAGTGHVIEAVDSYKFLGTLVLMNDNLVFHVFIKEEE